MRIEGGEQMNYRVVCEFSVNNDETEQNEPTSAEVIEAIYSGRIVPEDVLFNIIDLTVDAF